MAAGANLRVALIGLGEVGQALARDLRASGVRAITAYDIAFANPESAQRKAAAALDLTVATSAKVAVDGAQLAICAVTAGSDLEAAAAVAPGVPSGVIYVDVNSVSPKTKQQAAAIIEKAGGRYVEAAVMSPIHPKGIATPILLGGKHTAAFLELAGPLGFNAKFHSVEIGRASSVKMCRSIMVKGIEALVAEFLMTSHHYGVTDEVQASLNDLFPGHDWDKTGRYMLSRVLEHGHRRAEEMREVVKTIADAGVEPMMTRATVDRQQWGGDIGKNFADPGDDQTDRAARLDELRRLSAV